MSVLKKHYKSVIGSILLTAVIFGYLGFHGKSASTTAATEIGVAASYLAKANQQALAVPAVLKPEQLVRAATLGLPPASPELQKLLPGITEAVKNWKEFKPKKLVIAPYPDTPMEFEVSSVREENGRTIWTGRNALQGAFLTAVATENDWQATLVIPPVGAFEIQILGQNVTVLEKNHEDERCGVPVAMMSPNVSARDTATSAMAVTAVSSVAAADTTLFVDVLFFYDAETLTSVGTQDLFDSRMMLYLESSNAALVNSAVTNYRWRFLASYQVPAYTATNDMANDLDIITASANHQPTTPNPVSIFVNNKADLHGADQVVLYVGGARNFAGIAWLASSDLHFHTAVVKWGTSYMVVAHELGHGFGCQHDRKTQDAVVGDGHSEDGNGHYYYGYRFQDRAGNDTGTIMSYANFRYPYYSNPDITSNGYVLGVADDQPKAADNARVLRDAAVTMSNSRTALDAPSITAQPQSVTVAAGQSVTLSVTATGSNLTYQWKLEGTDIAGATGTSLSKAVVSTTDAGSYTVTISNNAGSVRSTPATVTVTTTTPSPMAPSPTAPAASGGGGGGGSVDGVFASLCGLLLLLRWKFKSRS